MSKTGIVFNVQRYTIHDGPGLRTEFFLKGCPLKCKWCGNPESQKSSFELGVYTKKCIGLNKCGECLKVTTAPEALKFYRNKLVDIDRTKTKECLPCVAACPSEAIKQWGKEMTVEECMEIIRRDKGYYERSGGGVTISGGDPLTQVDFVVELFKACKAEGYHTCFESDFFGAYKQVEKLLPYTDLFIADIKHMDNKIHKEQTGVSHDTILYNLTQISKTDIPIILRIPIIPGFNDDLKNVKATAKFILEDMNNNVRTLQLLSYMRLGEEKYASLNKQYPMSGLRVHRQALTNRVKSYVDYFNSQGIHTLAGTKEKQ